MAREVESLRVLFRDDALVVVDKPSGMLIHRGWGQAPVVLVDLIRAFTGAARVHPVQRLDRAASGIVLFALDASAARSLQDPAVGPNPTKRYLALVRGRPPERGLIDHPISNRPDGPRVSSVTAFRRLHTAASQPREVSLVEVVPRTGRLHQIRRHLKHINHPLIRDTNYGNAPLNHALGAAYGLTRLALHAYRLAFRHPVSGQDLQVIAGLPADLAEPFAKMGIPPVTWTALEAPPAADWLEGLTPQDRLA